MRPPTRGWSHDKVQKKNPLFKATYNLPRPGGWSYAHPHLTSDRGWSEYRLAAVCGCGGQKIYPTVSSPPPLQPAGLEQHRRARPSTAASPPPSAPGASPAGCAVRRGQPPGQLTFQRATFGVSIWDRRDNSPQFALASRSGGGGQQFPPGLTEIRDDLFKTLKLAILSIEPRFTCNASGQTRGDKIGCLSFQPDAGKHHQ